MIDVLQSEDRGHTKLDWLDSRHTFSFGNYYDPHKMGFRALRVINEDVVAGGAGFPLHSHADMEILTWVLSGAIEHEDSTGAKGVVKAGEMQVMTAGRGISHSESNPSPSDPVHLLQVWIRPDREHLVPSHRQQAFPEAARRGRLRLLASKDGREGSLALCADAALYATILSSGDRVEHALAPERHAWIQVVRGSVLLNGVPLQEGDGAAIHQEPRVDLFSQGNADLLLFDLA